MLKRSSTFISDAYPFYTALFRFIDGQLIHVVPDAPLHGMLVWGVAQQYLSTQSVPTPETAERKRYQAHWSML